MERNDLVLSLKEVFRVNLAASAGETVLVFTDTIPEGADIDPVERSRREGLVRVARAASEAATQMGLRVRYLEFPALGSHGSEPGEELWRLAFGEDAAGRLKSEGLLDAIREKRAKAEDIGRAREVVRASREGAVDAVVALSNHSTSHTRFRDLLTSEAGTRYASMPLFEEEMLTGSMKVDWAVVEKRARAVAEKITGGQYVRVTTADGTDITLGIEGRAAMLDTGMLTLPGSFSNLPAGEVYIAPLEGTSRGTLVINWAPNHRLSSPLTVRVEGGVVKDVAGTDPYSGKLAAGLDARPDNRNIAELGIGVNDKATRPDNILESEKILGTIHIAFGDNSSMGGMVSTPFHQDFVFFGPTVVVGKDGAETVILKDGALQV
jgi:leucyl aminopeptidase (aminopeptidase T)